jgi:HTH-type transcriptional regulator, global nitrogen regulator NrpRI
LGFLTINKCFLYNGESVSDYRIFMSFDSANIERKVFSILKVLGASQQAQGARVIARSLKDLGVELTERAVRYHLRMTDEKGLTRLVGRRDGRVITELGQIELNKALVNDKIGFAFSRIESLAFRTNFNWDSHTGPIPVNISLFPKEHFAKALKVMKPIFKAGLCVSDLVVKADEGDLLGDITVPKGKVALATVCSIVVNGTLLKAGVPVDSRFGGILQIHNNKPLRFTELINYAGTSLDPSEIFLRANMTSVLKAVQTGDGEILANFREIPAICRPLAEEIASKLKNAGIGGLFILGNVSEPVCEMSVELNRVGIVLIGGLNPVAATHEAGIVSENHAMSALLEYQDLVKVDSI